MRDGRNGTFRFWSAALGAAALIAYPLSFGPAVWLTDYTVVEAAHIAAAYKPIVRICFSGPEFVALPLRSYANLDSRRPETLKVLLAQAEMSNQSYPVGDLAFRLQNGQRTFHPEPLIEKITCTVECVEWDDVGGLGTIRSRAATETLEIRQTPAVHAAVVDYLERIREQKKAKSHGRELDLPSFYREVDKDCGIFPANEIRGDALIIDNIDGWNMSIGERKFSESGDLIKFLSLQPCEVLRSGIVWHSPYPMPSMYHISRFEEDVESELTQFCRSRDFDLFIKLTSDAKVVQVKWAVQAGNSIYRDIE